MVFIRYLLRFCIFTVLLTVAVFLSYTVLINTGTVRLPTYEESRIEDAADEIRAGGEEEKLLPDSCEFGVYDPDGKFLYGTFEGTQQEKAWDSWQNGDTGFFYNNFYRSIQKDDGNLVIIRYQMVAKFENPVLRRVFPNAEFLLLFMAFFIFVVQSVLTARSFGKYLKKRLDLLTEIASKVSGQDLDFERKNSDIREVDDVLGALFTMKEALKESLEAQWEAQKRKQDQISALAHDIKTPLTIIRGNAELVQETGSMDEIREWDQEILDNVADMEQYLAVLQEMIHVSEKTADIDEREGKTEETFQAQPFLEEIVRKAEALGRVKSLQVVCDLQAEGIMLRGKKGVRTDLLRAVENVLSNGVDYCPEEGRVSVAAKQTVRDGREYLQITVTDSGQGFSEEALRHGTEQFYQADKSRGRTAHYGMGLYIARTILEKNGGFLELGNSEETGGGEVKMDIPVEHFSKCFRGIRHFNERSL